MQLCAAVLAFMQSLTANHRIHGAFLATSCMPRLVMWTRDRGKKHLQLFRGIIVESEPQAVKHRFLLSESTELLWRRARFAYVFRPGGSLGLLSAARSLSKPASRCLPDQKPRPAEASPAWEARRTPSGVWLGQANTHKGEHGLEVLNCVLAVSASYMPAGCVVDIFIASSCERSPYRSNRRSGKFRGQK